MAYQHLEDVLAGKADRYGTRYVGISKQDGDWLLYTIGPLIDASGYLAGAVVVSETIGEVLLQFEQQAQVEMALFSASGSELGTTASMQFPMPQLTEADRSAAMRGGIVVRSVSVGPHHAQIFFMPWVMRFEPRGYIGLVVPAYPVTGGQTLLVLVILTICVGALILTVAVGSIVTRSITRPMDGLLKATNEVARGRLDYRARVEASDEIGRLTASFNQ